MCGARSEVRVFSQAWTASATARRVLKPGGTASCRLSERHHMRIASITALLLLWGCTDGAVTTSSLGQAARSGDDVPDDPPDDPPEEDPPPDDPPPPQPAPPPAAQGTLVRITAEDMQRALRIALAGTTLVLDTSGSSPSIPSAPFYHCTYPNQQCHDDAMELCMQVPYPDRLQCVQDIECPNIEVCEWTTGPVHSYINFGNHTEGLGAVDIPFNDIEPMYRDSWGPGGVTIGLNYVRATVDFMTTMAGIHPLQGHKPWRTATAWFAMPFQSNQPTLTCTHSHLTCPDLQLNNTRLEVHLLGIEPDASNYAQLRFNSVVPYFSFTRNMTNIPDWMITPFFDVDQLIKNRVNANVQRALNLSSSREALHKALTDLVVREANTKNGSRGVERFYNVWYESFWTMVVDYKPCPPAGDCPTMM
jgi:hypothetical protein